ncbi:hypothetical protein [Bacillus sp. FSL K6-6540]|uniref:hypothetical protein n=1 Tax=Bacillus sp. FSL K6-6540 TaxID=2921512 RepID=UPI0030FBADA3
MSQNDSLQMIPRVYVPFKYGVRVTDYDKLYCEILEETKTHFVVKAVGVGNIGEKVVAVEKIDVLKAMAGDQVIFRSPAFTKSFQGFRDYLEYAGYSEFTSFINSGGNFAVRLANGVEYFFTYDERYRTFVLCDEAWMRGEETALFH